MKIISVRRGFTSDHSSTSYEFAAIDKPLDKEAQSKVSSLSSRANPTKRTVQFVYNVDGYDIPGGWEPLMRNYYDVMCSEDYDWWTLSMAFDAPQEQQEEIGKYEFYGAEDMGVRVITDDSRVIVSIHCMLDSGMLYELTEGDYEEEDETEDIGYEPKNSLLNLLSHIRRQLMDGDYRALYAVWEEYGCDAEEDTEDEECEAPPVPHEKQTGEQIVERLRNLLSTP
ncbi:MAG: hypothetical protein ACYC64_19315 [Armatimonadota bacterium]